LLGVTAEALRANIDWKFAFLKEMGQFRPNLHVEGDIFTRIDGQCVPYNIVANSIHTKKLCRRLSSSEVHFLMEKGHFAFLSPLGATYAVHLRLI